MRKKSKIIIGLLLVYIVVLAVIGWPLREASANNPPDWVGYLISLGLSVVVVTLLAFVFRRRDMIRQNRETSSKDHANNQNQE